MFSVEIATSSGRSYRWDPASKRPENRCVIGPWASVLGDGFTQSTVELHRKTDVDWPDLGLLDTVRYYADDGSIAYEGRIQEVERSSGNSVRVSTVGWATYLRQRPFTEIYVDRDIGNWHEPPLDERIRLANAGNVYGSLYEVETGSRSIHFSGVAGYTGNNQSIPSGAQAQAWYTAPTGGLVASLVYRGEEDNMTNVAAAQALATDGSELASPDSYNLTLDDTLRTEAITTPRRSIALRIRASADHNKSSAPAHRIYRKVAVYGDHSVTPVDNGDEPPGVVASDVISDVLSRFGPKVGLETPGTTYPIGHLAFLEPTTPYDAIVRCNEFHHWNLGVYEGPTLHFEPIDLSRADWHVREDWGATVSESETSDDFYTGVPVSYEDIESGRTEVLWPDVNEELRDDNEDNPANRWGEDKWAEPFSVPFPCTAADALQLGAEQLLDLNTPRHPASITVPTRLKDAQGNYQPAHLPRAGQTIQVDTRPELGVMLITDTSYDPQSNTLALGTDYELRTLDAFLARLESARVGRT